MVHSIVGRRYALALIEVAEQQNKLGDMINDLAFVDEVISGSKQLRVALQSPLIQGYKKATILISLFQGKVSDQTVGFLKLLATKGRADKLAAVIQEFKALLDERSGIINVDVSSAVELDQIQSEELRQKLENFTSKKIRIRLAIDKELIGGLTVKIGDTVLDGTIRHKLEMLREQLVKGSLN
ncbi:MAG: F0F1 ATP synthase subunit delta [Chlorobiales bacterium]|jgi:F-type H+-transporting ATPase subunit delta|nr:F0F1 ATP synthase subunit delta [Chlorobiales bacterium]